jgi:LysM repeat protein
MKKFLILILMLGLLGACTSELSSTPTPIGIISSPSPLLVLSSTPSPSATIDPIFLSATEILPTPTPILYSVEQNDTLTDIARKFKISLEELVFANPSVNSQELIVGLVLVIPPQQKIESQPTVTPWPVSIQQTQCYQNLDGSLWCLALLKNENAETLQTLSVVISLLDSAGKVVNNKTAFNTLDLLPSGKSIAIGAFFAAPVPDDFRSQTQLLSASNLPSSDKDYPPIHLQNNLVQVDWSGLSARVSGQVVLDLRSDAADRVWILAVAYDQSGAVIGFRRWESNNPLSPADVLSFDFGVSSLGPEIDHIDLLVEAAR